MGNHTCCISSPWPGNLIPNSTASKLPFLVLTFVSYCSGVSISEMRLPSCASPHVPLVLMLLKTFFKSPTPTAIVCISPRPLWTSSSRSLTILNDSPNLFSIVDCNFSSTVWRIASSFSVLSFCMPSSFFSTASLTFSIFSSFLSISSVSLVEKPSKFLFCVLASSVMRRSTGSPKPLKSPAISSRTRFSDSAPSLRFVVISSLRARSFFWPSPSNSSEMFIVSVGSFLLLMSTNTM